MRKLLKDLVWAFAVAMILRTAFGFVLGSKYPFVAVMSPSMTHDEHAAQNFYLWMSKHGFDIEEIQGMPFPNGFNKGDAIVIAGAENLSVGDVALYVNPSLGYPIIHRVVNVTDQGYITKGDRNPAADPWTVDPSWVKGKAVLLVPAFGWIRVLPTEAAYLVFNSHPTPVY